MRQPQSAASSLITTLLVIVIFSTIVVAFMQSMSIDRLTARSAKNILQAELAARAGLDSAIAQILAAIGTNRAFVTGNLSYAADHGPIVVIGRSNLVDAKQLMPLVSTPPDLLSTFLEAEWTNSLATVFSDLVGTNSTDLNGRSRIIQDTGDSRLYRAPWVTVSGSGGEMIGRFAYLTLDETARLNPLLHTGSGSMANPTNWYGGPGDISLTNNSARILTPEQQSRILALAAHLPTPDSLAQGFAARSDYDRVKHLLTLQSNTTYDEIPTALPEGGRPKCNINELATNSANGATPEIRARRIAEIISSNLGSFASRDPSLRGVAASETRYLRRLAAGIVDYIDADCAPTSANGGEPAGRDLFPLVTAVAERFRRASLDQNAATTTIESQCFVQVWNPYTTAVDLSNRTARFVLRNRMKVRFGTGIITPFDDYDQEIAPGAVLAPNEFVVLEFPRTTQQWSSPGPVNDVPRWDDGPSGNADETTHCPFEFYIDGQRVDMSRRPPVGPDIAISGMVRSGVALTDGENRWQCSFVPTQHSAENWRFVGDSRATFLCNYDWPTLGNPGYVTGARWKGRQEDTFPRFQEFRAHWSRRDYVRSNPSMGGVAVNLSETPSQVASAYDAAHDAPTAPAYLANGPMLSLGELGHIFDPAQAADDLSAPFSSEAPYNNKISGGGRTLRIGQPEFTSDTKDNWNTNGRRAIELLDLFAVNATAAGEEYPSAAGRINPNTAPPEVLAAVLSGIQITSDRGIPASSLADPFGIASNIVSNRPYSTLSDLHKIVGCFAAGETYSPDLPVSVTTGETNLAAMDRVREEAFGKLIQHLTVQSRTYRIVSVGESFDPRGKPRGRSTLEAIVVFRNETGGGVRPAVVFQRSF
jgi:type II secretory pathway pseudopilin PulG